MNENSKYEGEAIPQREPEPMERLAYLGQDVLGGNTSNTLSSQTVTTSGQGIQYARLSEMPVSASKYRIEIRPLSRGYVVNVGCQEMAVQDTETLIDKLSQYLRNPSETEQKYNENTLFN